MIHAIIYDNRANKDGYTFYERTPGFPVDVLAQVQEVSHRYSEPVSGKPCIRYEPLKCGMYLLSVTFRMVNSEHQDRRHFRIVHFVMDREDAVDFFSTPLCTEALIRFADSCYQKLLQDFPGNWSEYRSLSQTCSVNSMIHPELLYTCCFRDRFQAFIGLDTDPAAEINSLQGSLPYALRLELSFVIGMETAMECIGIRFNFGSIEEIRQLQGRNYEGCPGTKKLTLLLQNGTVTQSGSKPEQKEAELAARFHELSASKYYPVLRYLIQDQKGLIAAVEDLNAALKDYSSPKIHSAIGKAEANNEIDKTTSAAFRQIISSPQKPSFWDNIRTPFSRPSPAPNPGRRNAPANTGEVNTSAPNTEVTNSNPLCPNPEQFSLENQMTYQKFVAGQQSRPELDNAGQQPEILTGNVRPADAPLDETIHYDTPQPPVPPNEPVPPKQATPKPPHTEPVPPKLTMPKHQSYKVYPIPWLVAAFLSLTVFILVLVLSVKLSVAPSTTLGVFIITLDGVCSIVSNILSYLCGGITIYALLRLFRRRKK